MDWARLNGRPRPTSLRGGFHHPAMKGAAETTSPRRPLMPIFVAHHQLC